MTNHRPPVSSSSSSSSRAAVSLDKSSAQSLTEQEIADRLTAARLLGQIDEEAPVVVAKTRDRSGFGSGFAVGVMGNVLLGFGVLMLQRAGFNVFGPGLVAMMAAALLMILVLGSWTPPVAQAIIGGIAGLIATYAVFWFFIGPLLRSNLERVAPSTLPAAAEQRSDARDSSS